MKASLRSFLLWITPVALLGLIVIGNLLYAEQQRRWQELQAHESQLLNISARLLRQSLTRPQQDLQLLLSHPDLVGFLSGMDSKRARLETDFLHFAQTQGAYDQLRLLDASGYERLRVNYAGGQAQVVKSAALQYKGDRYYFKDAVHLPAGELYVSPLDLNVENQQVEQPYKPVIRFAAPIFNAAGKPIGVLVTNFLAANWLRDLRQLGEQSRGQLWLLNKRGEVLVGDDALEWAFMFPDRAAAGLADKEPLLWSWLQQGRNSQGLVAGKYVSRVSICASDSQCEFDPQRRILAPVHLSFQSADLPWQLVTLVDASTAVAGAWFDRHMMAIYFAFLLVLVLTVSMAWAAWRMRMTVEQLTLNERELRQKTSLTETFVDANPATISVVDTQGHYLYANRSMEVVAGIEPGSCLGKTYFDIWPPSLAQELWDENQVILASGERRQMRRLIDTPAGQRYFYAHRFPMLDATGQIYAIASVSSDVTDMVAADKAREKSESLLQGILESSADAVVVLSRGGLINLANPVAEQLFAGGENLVGETLTNLVPDCAEGLALLLSAETDSPANPWTEELTAKRRDGSSFPVELSCSVLKGDAAGSAESVVIVVLRDISQRKHLELQLRHSQKMDAVGRLTGGIAHDFNNLLGVVMGNLDLLERLVAGNDMASKRVQTAQRAAMRGADLTRRLLAFSRRQQLNPEVEQVNELVKGVLQMAGQVLGVDIHIEPNLYPNLPAILVDASQLESVLLNLLINARDAMPEGGSVTVTTRLSRFDDDHPTVLAKELSSASYVCLSVADSGQGMPHAVLERVFEPFFTTKERGKGTGLGLAMAYGFAKQSGGHISIYSEEGHGTIVRLYLPLAAPEQITDAHTTQEMPKVSLGGKVLVVDDEIDLLEIAVTYLEELGLEVVHATDGPAAVRVFEANPDIDVLLTDVVMPGGMNGVDLAEALRERKPSLKVLYSSGFPSNTLSKRSNLKMDGPLVAKPYLRKDFAAAIRSVLVEKTTTDDS